jgi:hypothetical protein
VCAVVATVLIAHLPGTGAFWAGGTTVDAGPVSSGRLDVKVAADGSAAGDSVTLGSFGLSDMLPGDSRAATITVTSASIEAPLSFDVRARATTAGLGDVLRIQLWEGGSASSTGSSTVGWSGTCSGGTALGAESTLGLSDATLTSSRVGPLQPGATRTLCVRVSLPATAPASAQGLSSTISLSFDAVSVAR